MKRYTLRILGFPVAAVDVQAFELVSEEEEAPTHGGGSTHNFEMAEPFVDERYLPWEEDRFGFQA